MLAKLQRTSIRLGRGTFDLGIKRSIGRSRPVSVYPDLSGFCGLGRPEVSADFGGLRCLRVALHRQHGPADDATERTTWSAAS
jgi:hypothetical protein